MKKPVSRSARILWLEDQKRFYADIAKSLKEIGYCVSFAENTDEFEQALKEKEFDYVLIDIRGGTFNGIDLYSSLKDQMKGATIIFLSGWLRDEAIKKSLAELDEDIFVMDKFFPSASKQDIEATLGAALRAAKERGGLENNRTYYKDFDDDEIQDLDYTKFSILSSIKRREIRDETLAKARREIEERQAHGAVWFLVAGPDGEVIESRENRPENFDSKMLSHKSMEVGRPCFIYEIGGGIEEISRAVCPKHYQYYFTIDMSFARSHDIHSIHFDTGSERSWFDEVFLKTQGIGLGLDADQVTSVGTLAGRVELSYWTALIGLRVHNQRVDDENYHTQLFVNGLSDWSETILGGAAPLERLCDQCRQAGRCEKRIGIVGQDIVREPNCFAILLDGKTGKTTPVFPKEKKGKGR